MGTVRATSLFLITGAALWIALVVCGFWFLVSYDHTPGESGPAPSEWPATSSVARATDQATLLMFVHPHCPCSRASVEELARLLAHCADRVTTTLFFVKPADAGVDWERSDLWSAGQAIPGVCVRVDQDGAEALRFAAHTSGAVVLYGTDGKLLFSGGITRERAHSGDNDGKSSILSLLLEGVADHRATAVYGCPLFGPADVKKEKSCDRQ
ncbi:MAG: hypothetical protein HYR85_19240 [Planctomycetes bacterium]|nr:hypothetical protein [Planctomycetota bacterium]MBI3845415.1 hypothetical protein [Planctomycetota bacterium]